MPAPSPASDIGLWSVRVTVSVSGMPIKDDLGVMAVNITHEINKISMAIVTLVGETNIENASLEATDSSDFIPGNEIKITAGYEGIEEKTIFEGVIVKHGVDIINPSSYHLQLICKHKAVKLTFNQKEEEFKDQTDSKIISSIFDNYGLSASVDTTSSTNENFFQKLGTDWDVVLSRAEFNGFMIFMDGEKILVTKPDLSSSPVLRIAVGDSVISFSAELNAEKQAPSIEATAWDSKTQALLKSTASEPSVNGQGELTAKTLSGKLDQTKLGLNAASPLSADELKTWADGKLLRMRLNAFKGKVTFIGNASVKTGSLITLEGVGKKFNGDAFVSVVNHIFEQGNWQTTASFGLDSRYISEKPNFSYAAAAGLLPSMQGLQIGTVKKLSEDPQSAYRILVTLPSGAQNANGVWARPSNFYATSTAGLGFLPEVGDEVVVGFLENDPRFPIVLGSLYSAKNASPNPAKDENNFIKSITTKSKLTISFDDEKKIIIIKTPTGNTITMSDEAKSVEIKDQNSNSIKLSDAGIALTSGKDIKISATGNISIEATGKLSLDAKQDLAATSSMNISHTAQIGFTGKGNATAELSASGQTTVKGGIVMIN